MLILKILMIVWTILWGFNTMKWIGRHFDICEGGENAYDNSSPYVRIVLLVAFIILSVIL